MAKISIIIPTWKRDEIFSETIHAALHAINNIDAEIIVINDFPEKAIHIDNEKVTVVNNIGRGVTVARNYGAKLANAELVLFIDNDIIVSEENIRKTLALHAHQKSIIANCIWVYPDSILNKINDSSFGRTLVGWKLGSFKDRYEAFNGKWDEHIFQAKYPFAAFYFSVEKKDYLATGGFNENIIVGGEEVEFSDGLKKIGVRYIIDPENIVLHNEKDRTFDYMEWLKRTALAYQQKEKLTSVKQPFSIFYVLGFMESVLYKIIDNIPNKRNYDKTYARVLSFLKNIIIQKV